MSEQWASTDDHAAVATGSPAATGGWASTDDHADQSSNWLTDPLIGAGKGAASTVFHAGDLIRRGEMGIAHALGVDPQKIPQPVRDFFGLDRVIDRPEVQEGITPGNTAQKIGYYGEKAGEYLIPGKSATIPASMVKAAGVAGAQTGGDPESMVEAAGGAGALGLAGKGIAAVRSAMAPGDIAGAAKDLAGIASPRLNHALSLLDRIRKAVSRSGSQTETPALPASGPKIQPASGYSISPRGDFRQAIVDELNQPSSGATAPEVQPQNPPPTAPSTPAPGATAPKATSGNVHEANAQDRRSTVLARFLYMNGEGVPHGDALRMGPDQWKLAWQGAEQLGAEGVDFTRPPSPTTTRAALAKIKQWEEAGNGPKQ